MVLKVISPGVSGTFSTDLNSNFNEVINTNGIYEVDTSTDLNCSNSTNNTTETQTKTYSFASSVVSKMGDYLFVDINGNFTADCATNGSGGSTVSITLLAENITSSTTINSFTVAAPSKIDNIRNTVTVQGLQIVYPITASDRTNGMDIKLTINAIVGANGGGATGSSVFTSRAIVFRTLNLVI